jgi:hypothetical protein
MQFIHRRYNVSRFDLIHDMFTVDRHRVVEFCYELTRRGCDFTWSCSARTDRVDPELLKQMRDAGCRGIFFGIETGSQRLQSVIKKDLDLEHARRMIEMCDSMGMQTTTSLITGYPTETMEDFRDTVRFLTSVSRLPLAGPQIHILSPLPETPLTTQYQDEIYFDASGLDDAESGLLQDPVDQLFITVHNDIFTNFCAFPCPIDRNFLRRAVNFLIYGYLKCNGMMLALSQHTGDLLAVFERWDRGHRDKEPDYFHKWQFASDLIEFVEKEFCAADSPALAVTARFYRAFAASFHEARPAPQGAGDSRLALRPAVFLVTVEGDIMRVLDDLRHGRTSDQACLDPMTTVVVRQEGEQQCTLTRLPLISSVVLQHARRGATVSEVLADFDRQAIRFGPLQPSEVALQTIRKLEEERLIRYIPSVSITNSSIAGQTADVASSC